MLFLDAAFPSQERKESIVGPMAVPVLVIAKGLRVLSMYVAVSVMWSDGLQVSPLVFWLLAIAATVAGLYYKPWTKPMQQLHVC